MRICSVWTRTIPKRLKNEALYGLVLNKIVHPHFLFPGAPETDQLDSRPCHQKTMIGMLHDQTAITARNQGA